MRSRFVAMVAVLVAVSGCGGGGGGGGGEGSPVANEQPPANFAPGTTPPVGTTPVPPGAPPVDAPTRVLQVTLYDPEYRFIQSPVVARCSDGTTATGTTDGAGRLDLVLGKFPIDPAPCLLEATVASEVGSAAVTLRSFAEKSGRVNVNPVTDLMFAIALGRDGNELLAGYGTAIRYLTETQERALRTSGPRIRYLMERLVGTPDRVYPDPFPDLFTHDFYYVGDYDWPKLTWAYAGTLREASMSHPQLRELVLANRLIAKDWDMSLAVYRKVMDRVFPFYEGLTCTPSTINASVRCILKGKRLTRPVFYPLVVGEAASDIGIYVSKIRDQVPKTDLSLPFQPQWCSAGQMTSFTSTDSKLPTTRDPNGVFAEELVFDCYSPSGLKLDGDYTVEVARSGRPYFEASFTYGTSPPPSTPPPTTPAPTPPGTTFASSVTIDAAVCKPDYPGASANHVEVSGRASLPLATLLVAVLSERTLSDAEIVGLMQNPGGARLTHQLATCSGGSVDSLCGHAQSTNQSAAFSVPFLATWEEVPVGSPFYTSKTLIVTLAGYGAMASGSTTLGINGRSQTVVSCP